MTRFYNIIEKIVASQHFLKTVVIAIVFLIIVSWNGSCYGPEITKSTKPKHGHTLLIFKVLNTPDNPRWKFEYHTDAQIIMSNEVYEIGDTLSFTTRKVKREILTLKRENIKLNAEISQRDLNWIEIQNQILKTLKQYN